MEHVIALDWGRFAGEPEAAAAEDRKRNEGKKSVISRSPEEDSRRAVLERLESALALPPEPGMALYEEDLILPSAEALGLVQKQTAADAISLARDLSPLQISPDNQSPAPGVESAPGKESGTYQNRLMWMGTDFEERPVLIAPPQAELAAHAPEPAPVLEAVSLRAAVEDAAAQAPQLRMDAEPAAVAPEALCRESREAIIAQAPPSAALQDSLSTVEQQPAPYAYAAASVQTPVEVSKIPQEVHGSNGVRWFVLKGVLGGAPTPEKLPADASAANVPVLEVFSLAGGVGKTSLVATLGRALSARGERVLLVEATPFGFLPYFFGACDCRPGELRSFEPPASSMDAPIRLATVGSESLLAESAEQDSLAAKIRGWAEGASRVIVDVATGSAAAVRALSQMSPTVLVPLVPDVSSVITAKEIDSYFRQRTDGQGADPEIYYMLNQFDVSLPLHLEVAKALAEGLGERLLPFVVERDPAVNEALADGMTIIDYAPGSPVSENYTRLAEWVELVMAPSRTTSRSARWSER